MSQERALHLVRSASKESASNDHYPTPPFATYALLHNSSVPWKLWEPAAGRGWMAWELARSGRSVSASDLFWYDEPVFPYITIGQDYLNPNLLDVTSEGVVTNPPYGRDMAQKFIEKSCIDYRYVAMLCRLTFAESMKRHEMFSKTLPPSDCLVFSGRFSCEEKSFLENPFRGMIAYAWWVWDRRDGYRGPTRMKWLNTKKEHESWLRSMTEDQLDYMGHAIG